MGYSGGYLEFRLFSSHGPRASLEDGWQLTVTDFPWDVFNHVCPCDMCGCTLLT